MINDSSSWPPDMARLREETVRMYRDKENHIGLATIVYDVQGVSTECSIVQFLPYGELLRLDSPADARLTPSGRLLVLDDMLQFFMDSINGGFPLRRRDEKDFIAFPGKYVRGEGGKWTWQPLVTDWGQYRGGNAALDAALSKRKLKFTMPQLIAVTAMLCY